MLTANVNRRKSNLNNSKSPSIANILIPQSLPQIRHRFGLYDEITFAFGRKVRNCNWVRFLKVAETYGPQVNVVCTKISGEVIYEVVKPIPIHHELIVYYLPERPEELFIGRMKNSFYRRTMDSILEGN